MTSIPKNYFFERDYGTSAQSNGTINNLIESKALYKYLVLTLKNMLKIVKITHRLSIIVNKCFQKIQFIISVLS